MKVTLHVGMGKTGTTSIQTFLKRNQQQLLGNKIFYTKNLDNIGIEGFQTTDIDTVPNLDVVIDHLNDFLLKNGIEHFIWSLESLFVVKKETILKLKNLLNFSSVEIIIFVRRQDHWFESAFYQWGWKHKTYTGNYLIDFETYYNSKNYMGNYCDGILKWAEVFGKENIRIQPFEKEQMPDGLIKTFCTLAGLHQPGLDMQELDIYKNPGHYVTQIIGIYNATQDNPYLNQPLLTMFQKVFNKSAINNVYQKNKLISPAKRLEIINKFESCNRTIAIEYLHRSSGILFYEPIPDVNDEWIPYEDLDLYKAIPILVEVLLAQENQLNEIKQKLLQLEQRMTK